MWAVATMMRRPAEREMDLTDSRLRKGIGKEQS